MDIKSLMACIDILNGNHEIFSDGEVLGRCYRKYPGAGAVEIERISQKNQIVFAEDLKRFWMESNGLTFQSFGGTRFFSVEEVSDCLSALEGLLVKGVYPIAIFDDDTILIDGNRLGSGQYLFFGDISCLELFYPLDCSFGFFLERMIQLAGCKYWGPVPDAYVKPVSFLQD